MAKGRSRLSSVAWALGSVALGLLLGLLGSFVQAQRLVLTFLDSAPAVPWGAVWALIALVAGIRGATWGMGSRWGGWLLLAGWVATSVLMSAESPSGDVALSGGARQIGYLLGGVILGSAAATMPLPSKRYTRAQA